MFYVFAFPLPKNPKKPSVIENFNLDTHMA